MPVSHRSQSTCGSRSHRSSSTYTGSQTSRTASRSGYSGSSYYSASRSGNGDHLSAGHTPPVRHNGSSRASEMSRGSQSSRRTHSSQGSRHSGYYEQYRPESVASSYGYQSSQIPAHDQPAAGGGRNPNRPAWKDSNRNPLGVLSTCSGGSSERGSIRSSERSVRTSSSRRSQSNKPANVHLFPRKPLQPGQLGLSHQLEEPTMSVPTGRFAGESTYRQSYFDRSKMVDVDIPDHRKPRDRDADPHQRDQAPRDPMSGEAMTYTPFEGESWSHMVHSKKALQGEKIWVYEPPGRLYDTVFSDDCGRLLF